MATSDNPWVPGNDADDGNTPPWSEIMRRWTDAKAADIRVAMPCVVTLVKANNRVSLQPLLMEKYKYQPSAVPLPIIQDALVGTPRGTAWFIKMPIAVGDVGLAIFTDRSLDPFSASTGTTPVDPVDTRTHDLSDAVFYPGLYPFTNPIPGLAGASPLDMVLQNGTAQLFLQPGGTFMAANAEGAEEFTLVAQTIAATETMATGAGTASTSTAAGSTAMATAAGLGFTAAGTLFAASTGPLAPLQPGFTALATAFTAMETAATSAAAGSTAAAAAFTAAAGSLTTIAALFTTLVGAPGE